MMRGVRLYLVGSFVLVSLAGCGRGFFQSAEREPWRAEAEVACLKSGAVKETADLVRVEPISGPGVCGAQYPLKVAALGDGIGSFGFADELRPPGNIGKQPRWPVQPPQVPPPQTYPNNNYSSGAVRQPGYGAPSSGPISLSAPGVQQNDEIDLPAEGTPDYRPPANRTPYMGAPSYPPRDRYPAPYSARQDAPPTAKRVTKARAFARQSRDVGRAGRDQADGDAGVPDRVDARPLVRRFRAAGSTALVRYARRRDQADLRLFLPRHERQPARPYFRTRLRQRARHIRLRARRRPPHHREKRLERHAGRARVFCATSRAAHARSSIPCWRRAPTPIMPTIFMST